MRNFEGVIVIEVVINFNVMVFFGELYIKEKSKFGEFVQIDVFKNGFIFGIGVNYNLIKEFFWGIQLVFINIIFYGDENFIGEVFVDVVKVVGIQYYVYLFMLDYNIYNLDWLLLLFWFLKYQVEEYVRKIGLLVMFVYMGIYNNNFIFFLYFLFCIVL